MYDRHAVTGRRLKWLAMMILLGALLLVSAVPGEARVRVFISPGIVVPFGPVWTPYAAPYASPYRYPYAYPPVVVQPPPPPPMWHYCENPRGYYPYVPQCPGGWWQVPAPPPQLASQRTPFRLQWSRGRTDHSQGVLRSPRCLSSRRSSASPAASFPLIHHRPAYDALQGLVRIGGDAPPGLDTVDVVGHQAPARAPPE
jgi:hypothetical protein